MTPGLEQEWEIFARFEDHYHMTTRECVGTVFAPSRRAAISRAIREFSADVGRRLTARPLEQ
jgi:1,2-phenylacetyl-CoA epoxidase PaaB subunit